MLPVVPGTHEGAVTLTTVMESGASAITKYKGDPVPMPAEVLTALPATVPPTAEYTPVATVLFASALNGRAIVAGLETEIKDNDEVNAGEADNDQYSVLLMLFTLTLSGVPAQSLSKASTVATLSVVVLGDNTKGK